MRENLKSLEGKPVLILGDRAPQNKPTSNLELITSVQVLFPKLQCVMGHCQVIEEFQKTDHMWVPIECRVANGWWGYIGQYQRKDGKINWALRTAKGDLEEKHLRMRLMVNAYGRFLGSLNGSNYISNASIKLIGGIILEAEALYNTKDHSQWKDLAFQALDPDFLFAFNCMIRDLIKVYFKQSQYRAKVKTPKVKLSRGFAK